MNKNGLTLLLILAAAGAAIFGLFFFLGKRTDRDQYNATKVAMNRSEAVSESSSSESPSSPIQRELDMLAEKMIREMREEERVQLTMAANLRSYREMFRQMQAYAQTVERNLDLIEEISKDEFQEDVKLQAGLYTGKKPELVARHLEEFRAGRVGAILAKMKEKEASAVMDVWAKQQDAKVKAFYREVMAAYLNNRRRDANPELFNQISQSSDASTPPS